MSQKTLAKRAAEPVVAMKKKESRVRVWAREILTTGAVLVIVALLLAGGLTDQTGRLIIGGIAILAAVWWTAVPVAEGSSSRNVALGIYAFSALWIGVSYAPYWSIVRPGTHEAKVELSTEGAAQNVSGVSPGPVSADRANAACRRAWRYEVCAQGFLERAANSASTATSSPRRLVRRRDGVVVQRLAFIARTAPTSTWGGPTRR